MGGGASKAKYALEFKPKPKVERTLSVKEDETHPQSCDPTTTLEQVKKPALKKTNSDPRILTETTVFCPYVDLNFGRKGSNKVVQRAVSKSKSTLVGDGKLDYKRCDYFEVSTAYPWLVKNAHLVNPVLKDFIVGRVIGAGRFAKVHLVRTNRNKYMTLKVLRKTKDLFTSNEVRHVHNERNCMYELHSPFCMKLFAEFEDADFIYFALEYAVGGELRALLLQHNNKLPAPMAKFYLIELFAAVEHMHSLGYVHRDLRPENVCLDEEGHVKLVDFGYAAHIQSNVNGKLYTICCNPSYLSPELLNSKYQGGYGMEVDLWAFGVLAYELLLGALPFGDSEDLSMPEILLNILHHKMHLPLTLEGRTKDLLNRLLEPEAARRLTDVALVKAHAFFQEAQDWAQVYERQLVPPFVPKVRAEGDSSQFPAVVQSAKHWKLAGLENKIQIT